ncbi:MAG TPA: hypothetical protein VEB43_15335 [Anaeromyxobacter sp.]|nr:hypothetical protein [Anaeromyxobacter sp.]
MELPLDLRAPPPRPIATAASRRAVRRLRKLYLSFLAVPLLVPLYAIWRSGVPAHLAYAFIAPPMAIACAAFVELNVRAVRRLWAFGQVAQGTVTRVNGTAVTIRFAAAAAARRVTVNVGSEPRPREGAALPVLVLPRSSLVGVPIGGEELALGRSRRA